MFPRFSRYIKSRAVVAAIIFVALPAVCVPSQTSQESPTGHGPIVRVDLTPLGFTRLSKAARLSGTSNVSVDFVDSQHLLVTFNPKRMFKRSPECPAGHDDRLVHAAVVEIPSGKVIRETDWYLHDSRRYLWPLGSGYFLLRKGSQLYRVDSDFKETLLFETAKELVWVSVTPDGKQIVAETIEDESSTREGQKTPNKVKIAFVNADTQDVERMIDAKEVVNVEAVRAGFADIRHNGKVWLVRFGPNTKQRINIARIRAHRAPNLMYTSANTMLVGRCALSDDAYSMSAFALDGARLWRQRWNTCRYSPVARYNEDGTRFALATMTLQPNREDSQLAEEVDGLDQSVSVFDTATGNSVLSLNVDPPVIDAQNIAVSPDGAYLAVLAGTSVEIHGLPPMSAGDRAKYAAIRPEIPGLAPPASGEQRKETEEIQISELAAESESVAPASSVGNQADSGTDKPALASVPPQPATSAEKPAVRASTEETPAITFRTGTQVVALDVVVTDSKGRVVKGLQASDFSVAEDGKPQSVRYFQEFAGAKPASSNSAATPPPPLPPNIYSNFAEPGEPGATTVILLDVLNTPLTDLIRARQELMKFLKSKPPNAQFALFVLGSRLQMIQGFTRDGDLLLKSARSKKAALNQRGLVSTDAIVEPTLEAGEATARLLPQLNFFVESFRLQQSEVRVYEADRRMSVTVGAFAQLARYLSGIPGRKNLIWLSGSFQLGIYPDAQAQEPFIQGRNYSDNLRRVANLMGEAHIAVYPVNVQGLVTDPLFAAATNDVLAPLSMQSSTPIGVLPGGGLQFAGGSNGQFVRSANTAVPIAVMQSAREQFALTQTGERATMDQLANQTGGRAFYNTNGIAQAIEMAAQQGSSYYALSYTPANKVYNGTFRKIKVSMPGKKYNLSYRTGYYAVDPYAPAKASKDLTSGLALAAMQVGSPQSRQVVFGAQVVPIGKPRVVKDVPLPATGKKKKKSDTGPVEMQRYGVDYAVTTSELRFAQMPDGTYHDILNFMITAFDDDGRLIASQVSQMAADMKPEAFRNVSQSGIRLHQEIDVPVTGTALRLGVEDLANSHIGTVELSLPVPMPPDDTVYSRSLPPIEPD